MTEQQDLGCTVL